MDRRPRSRRGGAAATATLDPLPALVVEQVPIDRLRPDPANPRRIDEEELERFGFETDPTVVRQIMADPAQPDSRQYSLPMTTAEARDLNSRSGFVQQVSDSVRPYVKKLPMFGGMWIDQRAGGRLVIGLTDPDPAVLAEIDRLMPTQPDLGWRLVLRDTPLRTLKRASWRASAVSRRLDPTATIVTVGRDEEHGRIEFGYTPDSVERMRARRDQLERRLGVPVRIVARSLPRDL